MTASLVSGGAGFIGSHIVRALLERGDRVRVLDNFSTGSAQNLAGLQGNTEVLEGDLRDASRVKEAVRGVDYIFHHAAFISVPLSMEDPQICFDINVQGTLNLLDAARSSGVQRVILASSAAVYGDSDQLPLAESSALRPLSPYAASKQADEIYGGMYTRAFQVPVVALRYFNVFGPRQSPKSQYAAAIPIFIRRLLDRQPPTIFGDGGQLRDFIFVGDVARANLLAAEAPEGAALQKAGGIFNICTGTEINLLDLLEVLYRIIPDAPPPQFAPPRQGDIYRSLGNPARAAQLLGFQPQVSLEEGLRSTVDWMRA
jgi:UDP-glucose 4-epimerase